MENLISAFILACLLIGAGYLGYRTKKEQKDWREKEVDRYIEIKFSNGFIMLRSDEEVQWNGLSEKEKEVMFNTQQRLLKLGVIKIISSNGQRRLVRKEEIDARKKIEKKWQERKKE